MQSLDYGTINSRPFFCTCGVGFDAFVSQKFAESGRRGLLTYVENTLKEGLLYKPQTYTIESDSVLHLDFDGGTGEEGVAVAMGCSFGVTMNHKAVGLKGLDMTIPWKGTFEELQGDLRGIDGIEGFHDNDIEDDED